MSKQITVEDVRKWGKALDELSFKNMKDGPIEGTSFYNICGAIGNKEMWDKYNELIKKICNDAKDSITVNNIQ